MRKIIILIAVFAMALGTAFVSMPKKVEAAGRTHVVSKGESLFKIASWYNSSIGSIKKANNHWSDNIMPGEKLVIPTKTSGYKVHVVSRGESLFKIAKWYGSSVNAIKKANNHWSNCIYPGQKLLVPSCKSTGNAAGNKMNTSASMPSRGISSRLSRNETYLLAKLINGEARGESYQGQVAVGAVVLNRIGNPKFPNTLAGVIYEPLAFTAAVNGQMNQQPSAIALKAAREAANGSDPSGGAIYYYNPAKTFSKWIWSRPVIKRIGNHVFAK